MIDKSYVLSRIDYVLNENTGTELAYWIIQNNEVKPRHIDIILNGNFSCLTKLAAIQHPKANLRNINRALLDADYAVSLEAADTKKFNHKNFDFAFTHSYKFLRKYLIEKIINGKKIDV